MSQRGWIGVDLDGTLAFYEPRRFVANEVGDPIPKMVDRVKRWLAAGKNVRIFTARASDPSFDPQYVNAWCLKHIGVVLPITCVKDYHMYELWDDRAVQVVPNTGDRVDGLD